MISLVLSVICEIHDSFRVKTTGFTLLFPNAIALSLQTSETLLTEFDYPKLNPNPIIIEVIMRLEPIPKSEI